MKRLIFCIFAVLVLGIANSKAESTVYLLKNGEATLEQFSVYIKGANDGVVVMDCHFVKSTLGGRLNWYSKAIRKCLFKNSGRTTFYYSYGNNAGTKDWSDSITLNLQDGETYYIEVMQGKNKFKIKELTEQEYLKKTKKIKEFEVNPDYVDED